jgi:flagellar hook-basal body complex protein FliE
MTKRDEYVGKLKKQLDEWNAEASRWEAKAKAAQANLRADYEKQLAAFHQQRDQALEQMRKVQASSTEAWTDLVRGTDDAWAKMREAVEKARSQFKK